ncbi:MAG: serine O-acetyltransferase, partial [Lachnospiraceae bacterium]|nr:serine O-acetyltransferase [Lachnospiraceae bacterium]
QKAPRSDMDHEQLPAPVNEDNPALQKANTALCNKVIDLEQKLKELEKQKG